MPLRFLSWVEKPTKWDKRRYNNMSKAQKKVVEALHKKYWFVAEIETGGVGFVFKQHTAVYPKGTDPYQEDAQPIQIHVRTRKASINGAGKVFGWTILPLEIYDYTEENDNEQPTTTDKPQRGSNGSAKSNRRKQSA